MSAKLDPGAHDQRVDNDEQPFLEHLLELRRRLLYALGAVLILFIPLFFVANELYSFIAAPLLAHLPEGGQMIATGVAAPFLTPFKLTLILSLFLGMPVVLYQFWSFVSPGLYMHEKRFAVPLMVSTIVLFYLGMAFAYYLVFPLAFNFFAGAGPDEVAMMTDISSYLDFVLKMFFAFGIAFEIPVATLLLSWSGLASADTMAHKRPYVIVGCFIVGMLLTPPDVISQLLLAVPTWLLFEVGIVFARFAERQKASRQAHEDDDEASAGDTRES
jgi:sec-independent protein translocase protein TatC